jgi:hypothetical protein
MSLSVQQETRQNHNVKVINKSSHKVRNDTATSRITFTRKLRADKKCLLPICSGPFASPCPIKKPKNQNTQKYNVIGCLKEKIIQSGAP